MYLPTEEQSFNLGLIFAPYGILFTVVPGTIGPAQSQPSPFADVEADDSNGRRRLCAHGALYGQGNQDEPGYRDRSRASFAMMDRTSHESLPYWSLQRQV